MIKKGSVYIIISQFLIIKDLETQQELKIAYMHLKQHQETIDKFKETVSEKTTQISNMKKDLNKSKDDLQKKVRVVLFFGECPKLFVK